MAQQSCRSVYYKYMQLKQQLCLLNILYDLDFLYCTGYI